MRDNKRINRSGIVARFRRLGYTQKQIAQRLGITLSQVRYAMRELWNVKSLKDLV